MVIFLIHSIKTTIVEYVHEKMVPMTFFHEAGNELRKCQALFEVFWVYMYILGKLIEKLIEIVQFREN